VFTARYGLSPYIAQIELESVYCAVRTESLYDTDRVGECLLRGTD
jgi:hypothetical protein